MEASAILGLLPEGIVFSAASILLVVLVFFNQNLTLKTISLVQGVLLLAMALILLLPKKVSFAFHDQAIMNDLTQLSKMIILGLSIIYLMTIRKSLFLEGIAQFEFPLLILFSVLGMMLMISSNNFITLFLGLELQSLVLYILSSFRREDARSSEAGMKYFLLGALSTGIFLYGVSFIYGITGSCDFNIIKQELSQSSQSIVTLTGMTFVIAGLIFKIAVVPFHMWTPDVYEGTPSSVTAFLASIPKIAAFVMIVRVLFVPFSSLIEQWQIILSCIAVASMVVGAFAALQQENMKRLLAYSSIGNMGYALIGLVSGTVGGVQASLLYVALYIMTTLGFFACLLTLHRRGQVVEKISDLSGIVKVFPGIGFAMVFLLFSMAGIPPLAGFLGKMYVFQAAVAQEQYALALIGVITSVISAAYYLRVIKVLTMDEMSFELTHLLSEYHRDRQSTAVVALTVGGLIGFFFKPSVMISLLSLAAATLFGH
jgi:NADH-quinone oxidoreductase subunit N